MSAEDKQAPFTRLLLAHGAQQARSVLARDLRTRGFDVRATDSLDTLWGWFIKNQGDVAIIDADIVDTRQNGFELLRRIRARQARFPVIILSSENTVLTSILAARFGAHDYFAKPFNPDTLAAAARRALPQAQDQRKEAVAGPALPLVGVSAAMQTVYRHIGRAAQNTLPVLIRGEAGTGKSLCANVIHEYGTRAHGPFISLVFPLVGQDFETLLVERMGAAAGGTLFFDNIGALTQHQQAQLTSLIEQTRRAASQPRLIASLAHNAADDPQAMLQPGLLSRLDVSNIYLPPLRERGEDSILLAKFFIKNLGEGQLTLTPDAQKNIARNLWPGNVSALKNAMEQAAALCSGSRISAADLPANAPAGDEPAHTLEAAFDVALSAYIDQRGQAATQGPLYEECLRALEKPLITRLLGLYAGNQLKIAAVLGINRNTLRKKINSLGLSAKDHKGFTT